MIRAARRMLLLLVLFPVLVIALIIAYPCMLWVVWRKTIEDFKDADDETLLQFVWMLGFVHLRGQLHHDLNAELKSRCP